MVPGGRISSITGMGEWESQGERRFMAVEEMSSEETQIIRGVDDLPIFAREGHKIIHNEVLTYQRRPLNDCM